MPKELSIRKWLVLAIILATLVAQLPSAYVFFKVTEMHNSILRVNDIFASESAEAVDIAFITSLKREKDFDYDVQILVGPYKKLFGESFRYRLEQHLVFIEQSRTIRKTFLIPFDKTFYKELEPEQRKGILAHEMWHIFSLTKGLIKPSASEETDADNYAIRYVPVDTMINLCRRYEGDVTLRNVRITNLERQKSMSFLISFPKNLSAEQQSGSAFWGTPTHEFDNLIAKIKMGLEKKSVRDIEIIILTGPYFRYRGIVAGFDKYRAPIYYVVLDDEFLARLSRKEKIAVVAHEIGHILLKSYSFDKEENLAIEIGADKFAAGYVHSKHIKSMLDKAYEYTLADMRKDQKARKQKLERLARGQ